MPTKMDRGQRVKMKLYKNITTEEQRELSEKKIPFMFKMAKL